MPFLWGSGSSACVLVIFILHNYNATWENLPLKKKFLQTSHCITYFLCLRSIQSRETNCCRPILTRTPKSGVVEGWVFRRNNNTHNLYQNVIYGSECTFCTCAFCLRDSTEVRIDQTYLQLCLPTKSLQSESQDNRVNIWCRCPQKYIGFDCCV